MYYFKGNLCRLTLVLLMLIALPFSSQAADKVYTLAVVPNLPAVTLHKNWRPVIEHLSKEAGVKIDLKLYDKITTFLVDTQAGRADFVYAPPNMFFLAYKKQKCFGSA